MTIKFELRKNQICLSLTVPIYIYSCSCSCSYSYMIYKCNKVQASKSDWLLTEILFSDLRLKIIRYLVKLIPVILPIQHQQSQQRKSQSHKESSEINNAACN